MKRKLIIFASLLLIFCVSVVVAQRIRKHGALIDATSSGAILLYPASGQPVTIGPSGSLAYSSTNYAGTSSFQPIGIDLNLAAAAGGTTGKFLSPVMGNIFGTNLSKAGNYIGGGIFHYNIGGTNATTFPSGAVLGGIGDGTTTAKGAFVAYIDGDSALTTARAAFKVMHNNSTPNSKFDYGVDLYDASHDGFDAVTYSKASVRLSGEVCIITGAGVPVDYTDGTPPATGEGFAAIGSLYIDTTAGKVYVNGGTKAQPLWKIITSA